VARVVIGALALVLSGVVLVALIARTRRQQRR
jgi:hypothetical protein